MLKLIKKIFLRFEKRTRFIISTFVLTSLFLLSTFFFFDKWFIFLPVLILVTYFLTYFSIYEGIEKIEWAMLFLMPSLLTVSFYLFYFLFPIRWLTRLPFIIIYAVSIYANLLIANIFNVGVEKNLQLYRAAFSVNYFYQTFIVFLLFNVLYSFKLNLILNVLITLIIVGVIAAHLFWSIRLELQLERQVILFALLLALVVGEVGMVFSFVPFNTSILVLILTAVYYSLGGLVYSHLDERLFASTIKEYLFVLGFVFLIGVLSLSW